MLKLDVSRRECYQDNKAEENSFIRTLIKSIWTGNYFPKIKKAVIKDDDVFLEFKATGSVAVSDSKKYVALHVSDKELNLPLFYHTYSSSEKETLRFRLNPKIREIKAVFSNNERFHNMVHDIFKEEKVLGENKIIGRLEQQGLEGAGNLEVELEYRTPFAVWRGLPKEFLKNVHGFEFRRIRWPKKEQYSEDINELGILNYSEEIKDALVNTGLVDYVSKEKRGRIGEEHHFLVKDSNKIKGYKSLEVLEDLAREHYPRELLGMDGARLLIKGNFSRNSFGLVGEVFEKKDIVEKKGYVQAGDIRVSYNDSHPKDPMNITLKNATLEKISRFIQTGAVDYCALKFDLGTSGTIDFCENIGRA